MANQSGVLFRPGHGDVVGAIRRFGSRRAVGTILGYDFDFPNGVSLSDGVVMWFVSEGINKVHTLDDFAEDGVASDVVVVAIFGRAVKVEPVAMRKRGKGDVKLASIGSVRWVPKIGHCYDTGGVVAQVGMEFVFDDVSGSAIACAGRITGLDEFSRDHTVERQSVIKAAADEFHEVVNGFGCFVDEKLDLDVRVRIFFEIDQGEVLQPVSRVGSRSWSRCRCIGRSKGGRRR